MVFPRAAADFAAGAFAEEGNDLYYRNEKVLSVVYSTTRAPEKFLKS